MSEIHEQDTAPTAEELDDFDVEGHGLREVALGLSAASVVMGGVGAASLALDNPLPGTTAGAHAVLAGATSDAQQHANGAAITATTAADRATTVLLDGARPVVQSTATTAGGALVDANALAGAALDRAGDVVRDPIGTTDRLVDDAVDSTRELRDGAMTTADRVTDRAGSTVDRTGDWAITTAGTTTELARDTADAAGSTAIGAAGDVYDAADPSAEVEMTDEGTTASAGAAGQTVTVHAG